MQHTVLCHPALRAPQGTRKLWGRGEAVPLPPAAKYLGPWRAPGPACWLGYLIPVHEARQGQCRAPGLYPSAGGGSTEPLGPNPGMQGVLGLQDLIVMHGGRKRWCQAPEPQSQGARVGSAGLWHLHSRGQEVGGCSARPPQTSFRAWSREGAVPGSVLKTSPVPFIWLRTTDLDLLLRCEISHFVVKGARKLHGLPFLLAPGALPPVLETRDARRHLWNPRVKCPESDPKGQGMQWQLHNLGGKRE